MLHAISMLKNGSSINIA